jgi:antibiotic biosynthesis monooxygenase (ABM) superfamily enzyme
MPAALVVRIRHRPGVDREFSSWHAKMTMAPAGTPGFLSAEVNGPVVSGSGEWSIIQRFRSIGNLKDWRASGQYRRLIEEAKSLVDRGDSQALCEGEIVGDVGDEVVTEVVTTYVKPGKEREYREWAERIHREEARFPGYRGGFLQPPVSENQHYWTTLVRFATPEQLDAWLDSGVRRQLLREHEALVQSWEHHRLPSSFAGWFPVDAASGESPKSWKQSMLVTLMLFPIVMLEMKFLSPLLAEMNAAPATFIGNVISVFLLAWPFMPIIIAMMSWWLLPRKDAPKWVNPVGLALMIALYALEITGLSYLL